MLTKTFWITILSVSALAILVLISLPTPEKAEYDLLIKNANVLVDGAFQTNKSIAINNGLIAAIDTTIQASSTQTINADGKTIIPGLIDAHTHTYGDGLKQALKFGVTAQVDMFTDPHLLTGQSTNDADRSANNGTINQRGELANTSSADLFSSGMLATAPHGHGTQFGIAVDTLTKPSQALAWVSKRKAEGSDFIKLVYMPNSDFAPSLDKETAQAIIKAAHRNGLKAVAHISDQQSAQDMLDANIDGLVHQFADSLVTDTFLQQAANQSVFVIPTLSVIGSADGQSFGANLIEQRYAAEQLSPLQIQQLSRTFGTGKIPGFDFSIAVQNTKRMLDAGILILAGSDAPNPGTTYGASLHQELQLLVAAGFTSQQALNTATINPISAFDIPDRGKLEVGNRANMIILNSSPEANIENTLDIHLIIKNGQIVDRANLNPRNKASEENTTNASNPNLSSTLIDGKISDFSNGLNVANSLAWDKTDDSLRQGNSVATITLNGNALKVSAQVKPGFMFPWAGAGVFTQQPLDLSDFDTLTFRVRGANGNFSVLAFSAQSTQQPSEQRFSISESWQTVELQLSEFAGLNRKEFIGFAFIANKSGTFEFYLEDVALKRF